MPDFKVIFTVSFVSISSVSLFFRSNITEVLCCVANSRRSSKEGMTCVLAVSFSSSESRDTVL